MSPGIIFLMLHRFFSEEDLKELYECLGFDYNKVVGDKKIKIKSLVVHCTENNLLDDLSEACVKTKPELNWEFGEIPELSAGQRLINRLENEADKFEKQYNLPPWWSEFRQSIETKKSSGVESSANFSLWLRGLPKEQHRMVLKLLAPYLNDVRTKARENTQPVQHKKKSFWDKIRGR